MLWQINNMKKFLQSKLKNTLTLVSLLMMVTLVFPGATIDNLSSEGNGLGQVNLEEGNLITPFCDTNPDTTTYAQAYTYYSYQGTSGNNGVAVTNGQTTPPGGSNHASLTAFPGTQLHLTMTGSASPAAANPTVRATVVIGGQTVFDQTATTGVNGADADFFYDVTLGNETVEVTVTSTACNNVSTAGHDTYVAPNNGFDFSCGVDQIVNFGTNAFYPLRAYNMATQWQYQPIEVDVTSSPAGVDIQNLPLGGTK
jgi:hypothetical protein